MKQLGKLLGLFILVLIMIACTAAPEPTNQMLLPEPTSTAPQKSVPTQPPPLPTTSPAPTAAETLADCGLGSPTEIALTPVDPPADTFTAPQILPLSQKGFGFGIAQWLPDSQYLLTTTGGSIFGTIDLIDTATGEVEPYAERRDLSSRPIWLEQPQGVAFVDSTAQDGWVLRFSAGMTTTVQTWLTHLVSVHLSTNPPADQVTVLFSQSPPAPVAITAAGKMTPLSEILPPESKVNPQFRSSADSSRLAWSPDGRWLLQYHREAFLTDLLTKETCRLDLGNHSEAGQRWGVYAQWRPDSQAIALITTVNWPDQLVRPTQLTIIDLQAGTIQLMKPNLDIETWDHLVRDIAWSPTGREIMAKVTVGPNEQTPGALDNGLFWVDVVKQQTSRLVPDRVFYGGEVGNGLAWSPDGTRVAVSCPNGPLCLIEVHESLWGE